MTGRGVVVRCKGGMSALLGNRALAEKEIIRAKSAEKKCRPWASIDASIIARSLPEYPQRCLRPTGLSVVRTAILADRDKFCVGYQNVEKQETDKCKRKQDE